MTQPPTMHLRRRVRLETPAELALRNKRVTRAMAIIGTAATQAEVKTAIIRHDNEIPSHKPDEKYWVRNKAQKSAAKRLGAALRRLKAALNSDDLIFTINRDFPLDEAEIEKWCTLLDKIAATELPNAGSTDYSKRQAVQAAADFLKEHDVPLTKARSGKFCRMSEVFYRPGDAKLYHYCRKFLGQNPR